MKKLIVWTVFVSERTGIQLPEYDPVFDTVQFIYTYLEHYLSLLVDSHVVVVLHGWAAEHHPSCSLTPLPQKERGKKYNDKDSRVEIKMGRSLSNHCDGQSRLRVGR